MPWGANHYASATAPPCTRRVDYALFMVAALENDGLIHEAPAIAGCRTPLGARCQAGVWRMK
jgi:hypothetical protein